MNTEQTIAHNVLSQQLKGGGNIYLFPFGHDGVITIVGSVVGGDLAAKNPVLADVHAAMLLEGTKKTSKKAIQEKLDLLGATITFNALKDRLQFTIHCRKDSLTATIALAGEMLAMPAFPSKELAVIKKQFSGALEAEAENTRAQAAIAFTNLVYEKGHPNYSDTTKSKQLALAKISTQELKKFHAAWHGRSTLIVTACGDVTLSELTHSFEKYFAALPTNTKTVAIYDTKPAARTGGSAVVHIPGKASVDFMLGTRLYLKKTHKDYPALVLGSRILGNRGFTGRLMRIVREQEGLTYGVYAYLSGFDASSDGDLSIWGTFAPDLFARGRSSVKRELLRLLQKGFDAKEFKTHQSLMLANWYVNLSNTGALASAMHAAVLEEGGVEFLDSFPARIRALTPKDTLKALAEHIDFKTFAETAAGTVEKNALNS